VALSLGTDDGSANRGYRLLKRIARQMRISVCGSGTRVAKKLAYQEKAYAVGDRETGERMAQVMNSEVF
jgi:hypothetical protein